MEPATMSEQDGVRYLHLGTPWVQGAMRVRKPQAIELEYVQRMMAWMLWRPQDEVDQGHAVQLGLGAASITRFTHKAMRMRTTAVELNPTVIGACRMWFQLPADDARLKVVEADAGAWVQDPAHLQTADVLSVDLYDHDAAAPVLDSDAYLRGLSRRARPRRPDGGQPVRTRHQLRGQRGAHRDGVRPRPGLEPAPHARGQHRRRRGPRRRGARSRHVVRPGRQHRIALRLAGAQVAAHGAAAFPPKVTP
jgi:hypothetical protein